MALIIKNSSVWVEPKAAYVKSGGLWVPSKKLFARTGGAWRLVYPVPGSISFDSNGSFVVPNGVFRMSLTAIGGGGGAGNGVDGGANDDYGGAGGGAGGQKVSGYIINVSPGEVVSVEIGTGGGNASSGRDSVNYGGTGGTTYIYTAGGTYYLLGGNGGQGMSGQGFMGAGGSTPTTNSSFSPGSIITNNGSGSGWGVGGYGGAGFSGSTKSGGSYGGGNGYHYELDATDYGGGGAGGWSNYIREDNGNHPCWGGKGKSGFAQFVWGDV